MPITREELADAYVNRVADNNTDRYATWQAKMRQLNADQFDKADLQLIQANGGLQDTTVAQAAAAGAKRAVTMQKGKVAANMAQPFIQAIFRGLGGRR
ncbi:hypothetical protein EBZ38_03730 [bacterium]|nr:hypothetical protein [bacterium]